VSDSPGTGIGRRGVLSGLGATALAAAANPGFAHGAATDWRAAAKDVRGEMAWAWAGYVERAFGHDQIKPVSGGHESFFFPAGPSLGLSIVESLGTLHVMGLDAELEQGVRWLSDHLSFDIDGEIQLFESNIRLVGGLLSGYLATKEKRLLALARDLADRLMPGFVKSPTGLPYRFVNLRSGAVRDKLTFPAEFGTYIAEFGTLSRLTGDRRYYDVAKAAAKAGFDRRSKIGLVADTIDVETGQWASRRATIGPPSDSYYEYLWDGWQLFGDRDFKRWYDVHTEATLKHQSDRVDGRLWFRQVDFETGAPIDRRQSELAAFYAGLLGQGGHMAQARDYMVSWAAVQDRFGVLPEGYDYGTGEATRKTNDLRPEFVDSCLNLWLLDRDEHWRHLAHTHFEAMKKTSRAAYGYTVIADVTATPMTQGDFCPGYWWAEQMKYYWLIFSDTERFDYRDNYLSTEGNILLGFR
jgi:mannosyl-oligosaccharide alpha-1,2-mannosidase